MNKQIICLLGPTASGKTQLAIELAAFLPIEIVSVDSALIYRTMDIGTAKPSLQLLQKIPHYLINIRDPAQSYSAAEFCQDAKNCIQDIQSRGKIPLLVGGTMLYYRSLWEGLSPLPAADPKIRAQIDAQAAAIGWHALHKELQLIDPFSAQRIHPNDSQRLQRALEVFYSTGKTLSQFFDQNKTITPSHSDTLKLAIIPAERAILHARIETRFDNMLTAGLIEEVKMLHQRGDLHSGLPSIRAVGYRQVWDFLDGKIDYNTMREKAIIATRQLAKRQLTWLRSFQDIQTIIDDQSGFSSLFQRFYDEVKRNNLCKKLH